MKKECLVVSEIWNELVDTRINMVRDVFKQSTEYQLRQTVNDQFDEMMESNLTKDQIIMVHEILYSKISMLEQDGERLYLQGMKDGIWMLKQLGIFGQGV